MFPTDAEHNESRESTFTNAGETPYPRPTPIGRLSWLPERDEGTDESLLKERVERYMVDVLGAAIEQNPQETFSYRRRGEDTLTWGEPDEWIAVQWLRLLSQYGTGLPSGLAERLQESYISLQDALITARLYRLEELYEVGDREQVRGFLIDHPHLITFLDDSFYYLQKHFGNTVRYILELVKYPDDPDFESLVVFIATPLSVDEALAKLDALDSEWYLDQANRVGELINFNLELQ